MKRSTLLGRYIAAMVVVAMIFQTSCKKEAGDYKTTPVASKVNLNTYEYLKSKTGVYDSLLLLVDKMGIKKTLTDSTVTVFAPSNSSFQIAIANLNIVRKTNGLTPIYLTQLAAGDKAVANIKLKAKAKQDSIMLDTLVSQYIIRKKYLANDFAVGDGQFIAAVRGGYPMHGQRIYADAQGFQNGGSEIIEFANTKRSLFVDRWKKATTTSVNIETTNGIVHLLRPDHPFGFEDFVSRMTFVPPPPSVFDLKNDKITVSFVPASNYFDGQVSPGENLKKLLDGSVLTKFISYVDIGRSYFPTFYWIPKDKNGVNVGRVSNCYTLTTANDSKLYRGRDPRAFKIEGTLDDPESTTAAWVQLDIRQDQDWTTNYQQKTFDFPNTIAYKGYRLVILLTGTGSSLDNLFQVSEWTMNYREQL
jgi:uncharacterized surface protein with fasciclin (FAS1) repeats